MADIANLGFAVDTSGLTKGEDALDGFRGAGEKAEKGIDKNSKAVGKSFSFVGRSAGQAGIQVQQFVGQLQGGVAPMVALAQQGADLGIVLGAPLIGVLVSLGAVLIGTLLPSLMDSEDAVDRLKTAIEQLNKVASLNDGVLKFTDEIRELANVSQLAAAGRIDAAIAAAQKATTEASKAIREEIEESLDLDGFFASLEGAVEQARIFGDRAGSNLITGVGRGEANAIADELGKAFGLVGTEARSAGEEIVELIANLDHPAIGGAEAFVALEERLVSLTSESGKSSQELNLLIGRLAELFDAGRSSSEIIKQLAESKEQLNETGDTSVFDDPEVIQEYQSAVDKVTQSLQLQLFELQNGEDAAEEYAIAMALGKDSFDQVDEGIRNLLVAIRELKAEQEATEAFDKLSQQLEGQRIKIQEGAEAFQIYQVRMKAVAAGVAPELVKQLVEAAKANAKLKKEMDDAIDSQKELKKLTEDVDAFGGAWTKTGNIIVDAFGDMSDALNDYMQSAEELDSLQSRINTERQKEGADTVALDQLQMKVNEERVQAELSGIKSISSATASLFSEKTAAYKAFNALQQIITVAEIAMSYQKIAASNAETATHVANETTKQGSNALTAITSAFAAPFPVNFVAGAAMIGIMAALLGSSFGGGSGSVDMTEQRQETQGTGTVFGSDDKSASIAESQERFEDIQIDQLSELRNIRDSINSLNSGIANLARSFIGSTGTFEFEGSLQGSDFTSTAIGSSLDAVFGAVDPTGVISGIIGGFSKTKKKVIDSGISFVSQTLGEVIEQGAVNAQAYFDIEVKKSKFWGLSSSTSTNTELQPIDQAIQNQMGAIFGFIGDSVIEAASLLGIDTVTKTTSTVVSMFGNLDIDALLNSRDFVGGRFGAFWERMFEVVTTETEMTLEEALSNYVIDIGQVSFEGLSGEEVEAELQAIFSQQADLIAEYLVPSIAEYQQIGEGLFDTLTRVSQEQVIFNDQIDKMGLSLSELSAVMQIDVAQAVIDLTGGLENFSDLTSSFVDNFFTDSEKLNFLEKSLTDVFESLGMSLVDSREEFRNLVQGIDITTEEGQQLLATLLEINPALSDYIDELERIEAQRFDMTVELLRLQGNAEEALAMEREAELEALDESLRALQKLIYAEQDRIDLIESQETALNNSFSVLQSAISAERERAQASLDAAAAARDAELERLEAVRASIEEEKAIIDSNYSDAESALRDSINAEIQAINDSASAQISSINEISNARIKSLNEERNSINQTASAMRKLVNSINSSLGLSGGSNLIEALASARAGDFTIAQNLDVRSLSNLSTSGFSSAEEFNVAQALNQNRLKEIADLAEDQISDSEKQIIAIETLIEELQQTSELQINSITEESDRQIAELQSQLNSLLGIDNSILSVSDAINQFKEAQSELQSFNYEEQIEKLESFIEIANATYDQNEAAYDGVISALDNVLSVNEDLVNATLGVDNSVLSVEEAVKRLLEDQKALADTTGAKDSAELKALRIESEAQVQYLNQMIEQQKAAEASQAAALDSIREATEGVGSIISGGITIEGGSLSDSEELILNDLKAVLVGVNGKMNEVMKNTFNAVSVLHSLNGRLKNIEEYTRRLYPTTENARQQAVANKKHNAGSKNGIFQIRDILNANSYVPSGNSDSSGGNTVDSQIRDEIKNLRDDLRSNQYEIVKNTKRTANLLQRFELNGLDTRQIP